VCSGRMQAGDASLQAEMKDCGCGCEAGEAKPAAACGPGCDCGAPSRTKRVRTAVGLAVLCAVVAILGYKVFAARKAAATGGPASYEMAVAFGGASGRNLDAVSDLNRFATDQDAVFVFVPNRKGENISQASKTAVLAAHKLLAGRGVKVGLFTLKASSPDYGGISSQIPVPALLVMSKGRGMSVVTGEATEEKILQAYVASSRASACGPGGAAGCAPGACR